MINFFVDRPVLSGVLAFVLVIVGGVAAFLMPISRFPNVAPPVVQVTATYTGGSASAVEESVTRPLEQAINGVDGLIYLSSTSANSGVSSISATFEVGYDVDIAAIDVLNRVNRAQASLPQAVRDLGVTVRKSSPQLTAVVSLFSPTGEYDELFLSNYAEINLISPMNRVEGIGEVRNFTGKTYAIRVWLDPDKMAYHGLAPSDVIQAIQRRNAPRAAGSIGSAPAPPGQAFQLSVSAPERRDTAEGFERILVGTSTQTGAAVRLAQLGHVEFGAQSYGSESLYSGQPSAQIGVFQAPGANAIEVVSNVRAELDRLAERFPDGIEYEFAFSTATFVEKSIQNVVVTLLVTIALVVATVYLFLQAFRATLLPCIVIPVALIGSFTFLYLLGFSINTLSLLGMILAVGLVVDDAIVVVENVTRNMEEKDLPPGEAVKTAMAEVVGPVVATTLVLLGLFVPVAFTPGLTGSLYNQFALTIAVTVAISSLTALTLTPALSRVMLRPREKPPAKPFQWFNRGFERASDGYRRGIERLEKVWWLVLIGFALLLALVVFLFLGRPTGFVPDEDQGYLIVDVQLPPGAALERSSAVIRDLEAQILEEPGVEETVAIAGSSLIGDAAASYTGFMILRLAPWADRDATAAEITEDLSARFAGYPHARAQVINPPSLPGIGAGGGLSFEIQALDTQPIEDLAAVSERVIGALNGAPELAAAFTSFNADVPQLELDVDVDRAEQLGVPSDVLYGALQSYLGSSFVNEFTRFGRIFRVYVQAEAEARDEPEDIAQLTVPNLFGEMVPMGEMVDVRFATGPEAITHFDLYRSVGVIAQAAPGVSSGQAVAAIERVLDEALPSDYGYGWTGAVYQQNKAGNVTPLSVRAGGALRVPDPRGAIRELRAARRHPARRTLRDAGRPGAPDAARHADRRLRTDRAPDARGVVGQERHPDRGLRRGRAARRREPRRGRGAGRRAALAACADDGAELHPGRHAAGLRVRRRGQRAGLGGHHGDRRHGRGDDPDAPGDARALHARRAPARRHGPRSARGPRGGRLDGAGVHRREPRERRVAHPPQELHEPRHLVRGGRLALLRRGGGGVAHGALGVQVGGDPAVAHGPHGRDRAPLGRGGEARRAGHVHRLGAEVQHQRGLHVAPMDAEAQLVGRIHPLGVTEGAPGAAHGEHPRPNAQLAREDRHEVGVAAVAVHHGDLAHARARDREPDLGPGGQRRGGAERQRAGREEVLVGLAHGLHRKDQRVQVLGTRLAQAREHPLGDHRVGAHGQVRPVLLHRRDGQHGDGALGVEAAQLPASVVGPIEPPHERISAAAPGRGAATGAGARAPRRRSVRRATRPRCAARLAGVEPSMP